MTLEKDSSWWKEAVVYQIYPRSFKDSNGDGIGDIKGVISKLDYIKSLGIDIVWLNPVYKSPNDDMGYDISDYQDIMDEFGSMNDFDDLLKGLHDRGIKLVMDLVVNHTSDEHHWFQEARKSRSNSYHDYYHWWPAEKGTPPRRGSYFDEEGNAWCYEKSVDAYYLHYFSRKQPDLNWENPKVRQEIFDMMHFWFKKGIDGFRMDVITYISKDPSFPVAPEDCDGVGWEDFYGNGPRLHEYLREMNDKVLCHYDIMTVAEGPGTNTENILDLVAPERKELDMSYHFEHANMGLLPRKMTSDKARDLVAFKKIHSKWEHTLQDKAWGTIYLGNHDQPRMVSRWGNDNDQWRERSSKLLTTFLLSMGGTPFYYMGDELGMSNIKFDNIEDYRDLETINFYNAVKEEGGNLDELLAHHKVSARDNGRTPIQWNTGEYGGFSDNTPWIKVNPNASQVNVELQEKDDSSCLNYFREMIALRKNNKALIYGRHDLLFPEHPRLYAYTRSDEQQKFLVLLNFSDDSIRETLPQGIHPSALMISNVDVYPVEESQILLEPWQAAVLLLSSS